MINVIPVSGLDEIHAGDDLARIIAVALEPLDDRKYDAQAALTLFESLT